MTHHKPRNKIRRVRGGDLRSVRVPRALAVLADERARALGCTFTDVVVEALSAHLGAPRNPRLALLTAVAQHVAQEYRSDFFPEDVTRSVFLHIRDTPELRALYDAATDDGDARAIVNQGVGRVVALTLTAAPGERRRCGPGELIDSYAVLEPIPY